MTVGQKIKPRRRKTCLSLGPGYQAQIGLKTLAERREVFKNIYMRIFLFLISVLLLYPTALCAQRLPGGVLKAATGKTVSQKMLKPLSNASIEALVARGNSQLVIQRALGVAWQRQDPVVNVLQDGAVHNELLRQWWKKASVYKYRWEEGNMLGLNSWLIVLAHRIREGIKLSPPTLRILEEQIALAQEEAEKEFKKQYKYIAMPPNYQDTPAFLKLLGESVAYRLDTNFLPTLVAADRVRLLQVLMHGMFSGPVDWRELHTAVLFREIRDCLHVCARQMKQIEFYGPMKTSMRDIARKTAQEAAENSIISLVKLREMFIEDLQEYAPHFEKDEQMKNDWALLVKFFQDKQNARP